MNKSLVIQVVKILQKTSSALLVGAIGCTEKEVEKEMLCAAANLNGNPGVVFLINSLINNVYDKKLVISELKYARDMIVLYKDELNISGLKLPRVKKINGLIFDINCAPEKKEINQDDKDW
ncbi:hypothetical protein ACLEDP_16660 [Lonsdalea quercina]|uniref:hypothetical protein n=1 Tax=Lonsdalea quercina TaxID=71657 RepID=UPI00397555D5